MTIDQFVPFYQAVHNKTPFRWQTELLARARFGEWPDTIQAPTSSGKTSVIDIAVFLLALDAEKARHERRAPMRTFFVVDRRIVVDEAHEHSLRIARALKNPDGEPIIRHVAEALSSYGGRLPLQVTRMRGGVVRDSAWADEPDQPLVCLSTVDQVGSRLLFRGYQVSETARPVHAGMVGYDSLIVLDEAHLSNAFLETLSQLRKRFWTSELQAPKVVSMSATAKQDGSVFRLEPEWIDSDQEILQTRLGVPKLAELREPKKRFEDEVVSAAKELGASRTKGVIGVIVNTISSAREVFAKLRAHVLLIGRNRPWCAEQLWKEFEPKLKADREASDGLLYVVATQTVEVGADISFDALVTEAAPLDALRQRFGRLDRLGRVRDSRAIIVQRPKGDPVYGDRTNVAWKFLQQQKQPVDFGVLAMNRMLENVDLDPLCSERSMAPLVFAGHLRLWAQTHPGPTPDPGIAPFLHGPGATEAADVQIVWRENLIPQNEKNWPKLVDVAPPSSREALPMPIAAVRRWLKHLDTDVSDVEGVQPAVDEEKRPQPGEPVVIWSSEGAKLGRPADIRPGQTIVVPKSYRGADKFGWNPECDVDDIFDQVNHWDWQNGLRQRIHRIDVAVNNSDQARKLLQIYPDDDSVWEEIVELLPDLAGAKPDASGLVATRPKRKIKSVEWVAEEYADADDNSFTDWRELDAHTAGVVRHVRKYVTNCGLGKELAEDLVLAAELHDWGKSDERFQNWLLRGRFDGTTYYAKSGEKRSPAEDKRLRETAGYPKSARHEAASVTAAQKSKRLESAYDRDLVLHLIGSHHGSGRPWFPAWEEDSDFRIRIMRSDETFECTSGAELARVDSGCAERFAQLNAKYGYWGLAYLEAILRRADCMQSREEEEENNAT